MTTANQPANQPTDTYRPGGREITPPLLMFWFMESPKMNFIIPVPLGQKAQKRQQTRLPPLLVWHLAQQPLLVRLMLRLPTPLLFQMRTTTWERFKTQIFQVDFKSFRIALIVPHGCGSIFFNCVFPYSLTNSHATPLCLTYSGDSG